MPRKKEYSPLINAPVLTPCFMSEEDFEGGYKRSNFYIDKDFRKEYEKHMVAMNHISNISKSYILNNYKRIKDWSDLEVVIIHGPTGDSTYYYSYKDRIVKKNYQSDIFLKLNRTRKRNQNPVLNINEVVLDPTDGDFSITINGKEHWWIQDEAIIIIADYIEQQLKKQNEEVSNDSEN